MKYLFPILYFFIGVNTAALSQNYNSYFTWDTVNIKTSPSGGVCLMGGASEDNNAMI